MVQLNSFKEASTLRSIKETKALGSQPNKALSAQLIFLSYRSKIQHCVTPFALFGSEKSIHNVIFCMFKCAPLVTYEGNLNEKAVMVWLSNILFFTEFFSLKLIKN